MARMIGAAVLLPALLTLVPAPPAAARPLPSLAARGSTAHAVRDSTGSLRLRAGPAPPGEGAVAEATFIRAEERPSGFGELRVWTHQGNWSDAQQMYAAGFLEGQLTANETAAHHANLLDWVNNYAKNGTEAALGWLEAQDAWAVATAAEAAPKGSAFWFQMQLVLAQLDGLHAGYSTSAAAWGLPPLARRDLLLLNAIGDLIDIVPAVVPAARPAWGDLPPAEVHARLALAGHCSALIKVAPDLSDLLWGHSSWFTYSAMIRVYKHYAFSVSHPSTAARRISFSSYPGMLSSLDDFYLMGSGLSMVQTTNAVHDPDLYRLVRPESALAWQRVRVANAAARTGGEWAEWLGLHNSGTYANQYMVIDTNLFTPGEPLKAGLLTVVEQIPGLVVWDDVTATLERGYWPSYNVPYFPEVYNRSGYGALAAGLRARAGAAAPGPGRDALALAVDGLDYQMAPRAQIFRRDALGAATLAHLRGVLRSNDYTRDPLSRGSPYAAICARGDLDPTHPRAGGCYDTKATSLSLARAMRSVAVNGPTADSLPPFRWSGGNFSARHGGMPDLFDFAFETQDPRWPPVAAA